jgi:thioredoxin-related protein
VRNWLSLASLVAFITIPSFSAQKPLKADQILKAARAQATQQQKDIFLIFQASWCEECHELDKFLVAPEIQPIFAKYYVIARLNVAEENGGNTALNNPGGLDLLVKFGGVGPGGASGIPYICILNKNGKLIANSRMPSHGNAPFKIMGFPSEPGEIDQFLVMMKKGSPALTVEEAQVVKDWLTKNASS